MIAPAFWNNRRVFITGHTGFKGSWLSLWLGHMGAKVTGYSLDPPTDPAIFDIAAVKSVLHENIIADIRDAECLKSSIQAAKPDIVIHMAAQALVSESYLDPVETYSTNVMGSVNLLEAVLATPGVNAVLNVTSDKCYENDGRIGGYHELDPMGGYDPYSSSKGCSELVSSAYRRSFLKEANIALATARSGNVIGGGDWAKNRIVPDAIRSFLIKQPLPVRSPGAVRPWQHVLDSLSGYLALCQRLCEEPDQFSGGWNFGANDEDARTISYLVDFLAEAWGGEARWKQDGADYFHEAGYLKLDCSKSKSQLDWKPLWKLERTLDETIQWYKAWHSGIDMLEFTLQQIETYQQELSN